MSRAVILAFVFGLFCGFAWGFITGDSRPTTVTEQRVRFQIQQASIYPDYQGNFLLHDLLGLEEEKGGP